ncbi:MAG: hypothetical protein JNJ60_16240 [Rhodocyclaceae bacterium]|nr:hypothetical protein [Rhodocyclaceae bacterium]
MKSVYLVTAIAAAVLAMWGLTLTLINLAGDMPVPGRPLWLTLAMLAVGTAGFLVCLVRLIRAVAARK